LNSSSSTPGDPREGAAGSLRSVPVPPPPPGVPFVFS
jgi:hypothetical protein